VNSLMIIDYPNRRSSNWIEILLHQILGRNDTVVFFLVFFSKIVFNIFVLFLWKNVNDSSLRLPSLIKYNSTLVTFKNLKYVMWSQVQVLWLLIWWPLEIYIVVNFRARGNSRDARKLARIPTLEQKKKYWLLSRHSTEINK
jgi:hypothetical protein